MYVGMGNLLSKRVSTWGSFSICFHSFMCVFTNQMSGKKWQIRKRTPTAPGLCAKDGSRWVDSASWPRSCVGVLSVDLLQFYNGDRVSFRMSILLFVRIQHNWKTPRKRAPSSLGLCAKDAPLSQWQEISLTAQKPRRQICVSSYGNLTAVIELRPQCRILFRRPVIV